MLTQSQREITEIVSHVRILGILSAYSNGIVR
jgi:hypothetical protein